MKKPGGPIKLGFVMAAALFMPGCNRAQPPASSQSAPAATTASQKVVSSEVSTAAPAVPNTAPPVSNPASPTVASTVAATEGNAPKVTASDRTQTLVVWQHNFRLITHVLSIEGATEQTVEWWELRDANDHVV